MKNGPLGKELYQRLRALPWDELWSREVPQFDRAAARQRFENVAIIRAVGVVFSEGGPAEQREEVKQWLRNLLRDPEEKIRRYALAALPKIGAGAGEETEILSLLQSGANDREKKFAARALDKIGGVATLEMLAAPGTRDAQTEQKVRASVARSQQPSRILLDRTVPDFDQQRIHLRGRAGLEAIVREEVEAHGKFQILDVQPGLVALSARAEFTLADFFSLRCFGSVGFVLGVAKTPDDAAHLEALAAMIASPFSHRLLAALSAGALRYRLNFVGKGHQRGAVREVANRAYLLRPEILNDAREAPWVVDIHPTAEGDSVELRPRLSPDPRLAWRVADVPAASHPPLAACMARLAGRVENENVWDPFCGSGLELIERALLGGVARIFGTDRSAEAVAIAGKNFAAALPGFTGAHFARGDFRDFARAENVPPQSLTLIITNPPLGRRIPIPNLRELFGDLFAAAAKLLAPGGRLVFTNPFRMDSPERTLKLDSRRTVDLGGFDCQLEMYRKIAR